MTKEVSVYFRYFNGLPESTTFKVPIVNRSHLHCVVDNNRSVPNMTRLIHLDRIHSFRFFSSSVSDEDMSSEPQLSLIANTGNDFLMQEIKYYRYYDDDVSHHLEVFDDVISAGLWIVFLVLDALLLVYRLTTMYSNGLVICRHFKSSSSSHRILSNSDSTTSVQRTLASSAETTDAKNPEYTISDFASPVACETSSDVSHSRTADGSKALQSYGLICSCSSREGSELTRSSDAVSSAHWFSARSNGEAAKSIVIEILQSRTILKFIVTGIVLLLSNVTIRAAALLLDVRVFIAFDCFNIYVNAIRTQMNESDWSLLEEAQHLNQLAISFYRNHVQSELANLQVLLEYFNSGIYKFIQFHETIHRHIAGISSKL